MKEEKRVVPPTKIAERKTLWETKYKSMLDPLMPTKPKNYLSANHSTAGPGSDVPFLSNSEPPEECDREMYDDELADL